MLDAAPARIVFDRGDHSMYPSSLTQFFHRTPFEWFGPAFHAAID
jgi:hypothetical protein